MDEEPIYVGVVTVTYNSMDVLEEFISSLDGQEFPDFQVYAVDNASKDGSADYLLTATVKSRAITVIRNTVNVGVADGNNQGIQLAFKDGCTHILLLNNDTAFPSDLFQRLIWSAKDGRHQVVVPKIYRYSPNSMLWYAGGRFNKPFGYSAVHFGDGQMDLGEYDEPTVVEYAPTCCMLIDKQILDGVGLMDPRYFVYYDDVDFCFRLSRLNMPIWYEPDATLFHKVGSLTGGKTSAFSARMSTRNKIYFLRKNFSLSRAVVTAFAYGAYSVFRCLFGYDSIELLRVRVAALVEGFKMQVGQCR
ncbi:MAG: glycosyltransferase family 2 protein [Pseudomonadota bacterium]|jgi:GT2 family glycosyltransferase|nr:glycosyltransferase family 2 protein [Pseudomonadota bacterium]